jgi:hypothetical protein
MPCTPCAKTINFEHLLSATKAKHQVQRRLLLNVVVGERSAVFQLLSGEDETLLVRRNALLILDLALHVVDGVGGLDLKRDRLSCERLYENLLDTSQQVYHTIDAGGDLRIPPRRRKTRWRVDSFWIL